jgi:hypothetical protein
MITLTIGQLLDASDTLAFLRKAPLPPVYGFKVAVFLTKVLAEIQAAHEGNLQIFRRYGTESDGQIQVPANKLAAMQAELAPFRAEQVQIDCSPLPRLLIDKLPAISADQILALMPLLEPEKETDK